MHLSNRLIDLIEDWKFLIRQDDAKSALAAIGLTLLNLPYQRLNFLVVARSLFEPIIDQQPKIPLEIRPFEHSDLRLVREINRPSEARFCAKRLDYGHYGLVALHQGQLTGYGWGCTIVNPELDRVYLELKPGDVLCVDVYTSPAFRRRGVQTALTTARLRMFHEMGYKRVICSIENNNSPSLEVWQRKLGGVVIGRIDYLRVGPWWRCVTTETNNISVA